MVGGGMETMANTLNILSHHALGEKLPCKSEELSNCSCFLSLTRVYMSSSLIFLYSQPPRGEVMSVLIIAVSPVPRTVLGEWVLHQFVLITGSKDTHTHTVAGTYLLPLQD